ncbi:helix-turn-helix domain-containing protein [Glycocaulis alkaliphilus]|nr:helix-turn-helix domain-containing protein [Glycocaulis alkaliphilus]
MADRSSSTNSESRPKGRGGPRMAITPAGAIADVVAKLMTHGDYLVLSAIGTYTDNKGWTYPIRQSRIASVVQMSHDGVNRALARLEWLGWVQVRRPDRSDKPCAYRVRLDVGDEREAGETPAKSFDEFKAERKRTRGAFDIPPASTVLQGEVSPYPIDRAVDRAIDPHTVDGPSITDVDAVTSLSYDKSPDPLLTETGRGGQPDEAGATRGAEPASGNGKAAPLSQQAMAGLSRQPGPASAGGNIAKGLAGRPEGGSDTGDKREAHPLALNGQWRASMDAKIGREARVRDLNRCGVSKDGRVLTCQCPFHARHLAERYGTHLAEFFHAITPEGAPPVPLRGNDGG